MELGEIEMEGEKWRRINGREGREKKKRGEGEGEKEGGKGEREKGDREVGW